MNMGQCRDPDFPGSAAEPPEPEFPRLGRLLAEVPDWDRAVIPPVEPEFTVWLAKRDLPVVQVTRLADSVGEGISASRYAIVQPTGDLGRYQLRFLYRDPGSDGNWIAGRARPRMDIRAALTEVARLVAESA